jgi:RimJ/RimL family protein N-acetyltransferase
MRTLIYTGDLTALGPLTRESLVRINHWANDPFVMMPLCGHLRPKTMADTEAWYETVGKGDPNKATFLIFQYERQTMTLDPIGVCALDINRLDQNAALSIWIGERDCWGQGMGTDAIRLLLRHGFEQEGLHSVRLAVFADNPGAILAYKRAGFREIGLQREGVLKQGQFVDVLHMDILAAEFGQ